MTRALVYSYFPMPKDHCAGGAQSYFRDLILSLSRRGIFFDVVCPSPVSSLELLSADRVAVYPELRAPASGPLRFDERAANLRVLAERAIEADVVWTLDEPFPLVTGKPIVSSLCTIAYPDEIQSVLSLNWDMLVTASDFLTQCVDTVVGLEFWAGSPVPTVVSVPSGIDLEVFRRTDARAMRARLGLSPDDRCLLFPHRPEPAKGIEQALDLLERLVVHDCRFKLLVPTHPRSIASSLNNQRAFYADCERAVTDRGLAASVVFHPWLDLNDMPAYFSLGEWCLVLSTLPEGFGLVTIQAIACGTPVISTPCGSLRERVPPGHGVSYVAPRRIDAMEACILEGKVAAEIDAGTEYVRSAYCLERSADLYYDILTSAHKTAGRLRLGKRARTRLAPWCYLIEDESTADQTIVWHDLRATRVMLSGPTGAAVRALLRTSGEMHGIHTGIMAELDREGLLVAQS